MPAYIQACNFHLFRLETETKVFQLNFLRNGSFSISLTEVMNVTSFTVFVSSRMKCSFIFVQLSKCHLSQVLVVRFFLVLPMRYSIYPKWCCDHAQSSQYRGIVLIAMHGPKKNTFSVGKEKFTSIFCWFLWLWCDGSFLMFFFFGGGGMVFWGKKCYLLFLRSCFWRYTLQVKSSSRCCD